MKRKYRVIKLFTIKADWLKEVHQLLSDDGNFVVLHGWRTNIKLKADIDKPDAGESLKRVLSEKLYPRIWRSQHTSNEKYQDPIANQEIVFKVQEEMDASLHHITVLRNGCPDLLLTLIQKKVSKWWVIRHETPEMRRLIKDVDKLDKQA